MSDGLKPVNAEPENFNAMNCHVTGTSDPADTNSMFPKFTTDWDKQFVDRLDVRCVEEDIINIVNSKWCLFHLRPGDYHQIERCLEACDLKLDYNSLDGISTNIVTPLTTWASTWGLNNEQLKIMRTEPLLEKFEIQLEEFNYCLAHIIAQRRPDQAVTQWKYLTLFKKLLQLFNFYTWSPPFIEPKETRILGRTMSSTADILCCRPDPGLEKSVLCLCEIKKQCPGEEDTKASPPRKRLRGNPGGASVPEDSTDQHTLLSQHIGGLFVHLSHSLRNQGILGMHVEKTLVRITFLHVEQSSMEEIQHGSSTDSVRLDEMNRPVFYFSKCYNYLKHEERRTLFKALLLIKMMQMKYEKGST